MATGKKQYVYRLMKAKCSCGDKDFKQVLNLPKDHGVTFANEEQPLMNANDHIANENIIMFGRCKSFKNPNGWFGASLAGTLTNLGPIGVLVAKGVIGCLCEPMTLTPWLDGDDDYRIEGAPALTIESTLPCYYGGIITIVVEKTEVADSETEDEKEEDKDIKEQLPSEVKEKIDSFCDEENKNSKAYGQEAIDAENPGIPQLSIEDINRIQYEINSKPYLDVQMYLDIDYSSWNMDLPQYETDFQKEMFPTLLEYPYQFNNEN